MDLEIKQDQELKALGDRIKSIRKDKTLTQRQVSDIMNIDEANYQRIERGATNPTFKTLLLLAKAFDIHISELFK